MKHIVRALYNYDDQQDSPRLLIQGDFIEDYVDPATVRVFAIWVNFAGKEVIGPEITDNSKASTKLANRMAVHLTKLARTNGSN
tara:strand:- start:186 stop:437 length:252 start_codon:yes stop_codon:yes gene_type:complete